MLLPFVLAVMASLLIGLSDASGRMSARRADARSHVIVQMLVGVPVSLVGVAILGSKLAVSDIVVGSLSGVSIAVGLSIVYAAMASSSATIVAPTAAVLAAVIPLAWDLIGGAQLTAGAALGCAVALLSLALTTYNPAVGARLRDGVGKAVLGGSLFGIGVVLVADTTTDAGAWPAVAQRGAGFVVLAIYAARMGIPTFLPVGVRRFGLLGGFCGAAGMVCWIVGAQRGDIGTVSVVASTYPAVVAITAAVFDNDQIRWWQAVGIAGSIAGTALIVTSV